MLTRFSRENSVDGLFLHLLKALDDESGIDLDFIGEAIARFDEDEALKGAFVQAMVDISRGLAGMSMIDDYKPYINVRRDCDGTL